MTRRFVSPPNTKDDALELVGGKGRSLARMANAGFSVPGGLQVTTAACRSFIEENDLEAQIMEWARPELINGSVPVSDSMRCRGGQDQVAMAVVVQCCGTGI